MLPYNLNNYHPDIQTFFSNIGVEHIPTIAKLLNGHEEDGKNIYVFHGSDNGKTAITHILINILKLSAMYVDPDFILHPVNLPLPDSRKLLIINDPSVNKLSSLLKQVNGNDEITIRKLFGRKETFKPKFKILIQTNELPYLDNALKSRIQFVKFNELVHKDHELVDRILYQHINSIQNLLGLYQKNVILNEINGADDDSNNDSNDDNEFDFTIKI
jgi:hypothetical protein